MHIVASEVVGQEVCEEWGQNVFFEKTSEEQEALIAKNLENDGIYLTGLHRSSMCTKRGAQGHAGGH